MVINLFTKEQMKLQIFDILKFGTVKKEDI